MSELKVNTINPSSGTVLNTNALDFVLGNSGQSNTLIVSSATNENLATVDGSFRIYTTDGTVKSTYGYKSSGPSESLGTVSAHNLNLITNNLTRLTVQSGGDVVIPGGGRLGVGMNPAIVGQVISSSYTWNGMTRISVYNSDTGTNAIAAYHLNNNFCNGYVGIYGTGNSSYKNAVSLEADVNANGGVFLYSGNTTAPIRFINYGGERMRIDATGNVGIGTNSPNATLQIDGANGTVQGLFVNQNGTDVDTLAGTLSQMWTRAPVHLKMAGTSTTRLLLGGVTGGAAGIQSSNSNGAGSLPLVIQPFGGSVGIGATAGSSSSLMINSSSAINGAPNRGGLVITNPSNTRQIQFGINDTSNVAWIEGWVPGTGGSALCLNPTSSGGYVGIGTTGPTALLHVQGTFYVSGGATFGASTTFTTTANANATPTAGTHIANKDYVDNRYRVGATVVITGTNNLTGTATNVPANWSVIQSSTSFSITIPTAATNSTTGGGTWYGSLITRGAAGVCDMWPVSVVGNGAAVTTTVSNSSAQGFTLILIRTA